MNGFILAVNGQEVRAGLKDGVVSVILTQISNEVINEVEIDVQGLETTSSGSNIKHAWYNSKLNIGDEITVKVSEAIQNTEPINTISSTELSDDEKKLKTFNLLKEELEKKGLI